MWTYILHWKKGLQYQNMICSVQQIRDIYRKIYEIWEASWAPLICVNVYHFNCVRKCNSVPEMNVYDTAWCSEHLTALPVLAYIPPHWNILFIRHTNSVRAPRQDNQLTCTDIFCIQTYSGIISKGSDLENFKVQWAWSTPSLWLTNSKLHLQLYSSFYFPLCFPSSSDVLAKSLTWALINLTQLLRCTDSKS